MTRKTVRRVLGLLTASAIAVMAFAQGAYWESNLSGGPFGDRVVMQKMFYMPKMAKTLDGSSGQTIIIRMDKEMLYTIDPSKREYSEMTFAELEKAMQKTNAKTAEMQKRLESLPPEQRKMMEQMMGNQMSGGDKPVTVKATGEKRTISGYNCSKYSVMQDDKEILTVWATKDISQFETMRKDWEQMSRRLSSMSPGKMQAIADAMQRVQGFPIETDLEQGIKNVVTKFEKQTTPASEFEVPSGYTKVDNQLKKLDEKQ